MEDYRTIREELQNFNEELAALPQIVAANKCDIASQEQVEAFCAQLAEQTQGVFPISAATRSGVDALMKEVWRLVKSLPPIKQYEIEHVPLSMRERLAKNVFDIRVEDGVYLVEADWLMPTLGMVDMDDYESLQYFQRVLRSSGIIDRLEEMGIQEGDTVSILNFEFDYIK